MGCWLFPVVAQSGSRKLNAGSVPAAAAASKSLNRPKWPGAALEMSVNVFLVSG